MGFKDYKIRDGVHIPSDKFRKNWDAIFGNKKKKPEKEFKPEGENSEKPLILIVLANQLKDCLYNHNLCQ